MSITYFGRTSKPRTHYTKEQNLSFQNDIYNIYLDEFTNFPTKHPGALLLDSSLITQTSDKCYKIKIIDCGEYSYVYEFKNKKIKADNNLIKYKDKKVIIDNVLMKYKAKQILEMKLKKENIIKYEELNIKKENKEPKLKKIEIKNINRSKHQLQMLIKTNESKFKTFITLTFDDEIKTITQANSKFNIFKTMIKRVKDNFVYICVPEFQKNGRVHYHLLTNIDYNDLTVINENISYYNLLNKINSQSYKLCYSFKLNCSLAVSRLNDFNVCLRYQSNQSNKKLHNTKKTYNYKSHCSKIFKTLKFWNYGYSNVVSIDNINIVGYLTKYLSKDIDDRLFGFRRYLYSQNLKKPTVTYIDLDDKKDSLRYLTLVTNCEEIYSSSYFDKFGQVIDFTEYKKIP